MQIRLLGMGVVGLALLGCAGILDNSAEFRVQELELQTIQLQSEVASLRTQLDKCKQDQRQALNPQDLEAGADELFKKIKDDIASFRMDEAKKKAEEFRQKYQSTRVAKRMDQVQRELAIIGSAAGELKVEKWLQGSTAMNEGKVTLLVFFEEWCPHCKREVPKLQRMYTNLKSKGLNIVGLTKLSKSSTEPVVMDFIRKEGLTYPIGKDDGSLSKRFAIRGIPAAALVKGGKVVWRGHPARLNEENMRTYLNDAEASH